MQFLLRSTTTTTRPPDPSPSPSPSKTLQGLIAEDPIPPTPPPSNARPRLPLRSHDDVADDAGWIAVPYGAVPEEWSEAEGVEALREMDRGFVFPGEQLHILACLATSKQEGEVVSPSKVAKVTSKNGSIEKTIEENMESIDLSVTCETSDAENGQQDVPNEHTEVNGETFPNGENTKAEKDFSATSSFTHKEENQHYTETLLEKFRSSHFFVRIAEADESLWSKRTSPGKNDVKSKESCSETLPNAIIVRGKFEGHASGGLARNTVRCCYLPNGDIAILLQVNVGVESSKNPVLEVLQFEKCQSNHLHSDISEAATLSEDPYGELVRWLFPLDNALSPPPLTPPTGSSPAVTGSYHRPTLSSSPSSPLFSFGNFRSYSMPALQQTAVPPSAVVPPPNIKPKPSLETFDQFPSENLVKNEDIGAEGQLSFRGVPLEPQQFSVQCGLEGIYLPGKRWRKKLQIIQPIELHSFGADCNTEDVLCVQIKNISPAHIPDLVIFLDAINIIFEEVPGSGPPVALPVSCIETGSGHKLPNIALRRGEEHSFMLKPSSFFSKHCKAYGDKISSSSHSKGGVPGSTTLTIPKITGGSVPSNLNKYAVLVSYRCNYTESKLFFKRETTWRPHVGRDLMISVASDISKQALGHEGRISQLPVQALTLQASNLTTEDLTLMVLAPASFTAPPSVVSLNSAPTTPVGPLAGFSESIETIVDRDEGFFKSPKSAPLRGSQKENYTGGKRSMSVIETSLNPDVVTNSDLSCTHLWLQSTVPLGCVPARSSATVKLELLPLTDGIITLDTLQVAIKEKGMTYVPEHSLKIHATSSIATGIV